MTVRINTGVGYFEFAAPRRHIPTALRTLLTARASAVWSKLEEDCCIDSSAGSLVSEKIRGARKSLLGARSGHKDCILCYGSGVINEAGRCGDEIREIVFYLCPCVEEAWK